MKHRGAAMGVPCMLEQSPLCCFFGMSKSAPAGLEPQPSAPAR